jgi:hypothetical protein
VLPVAGNRLVPPSGTIKVQPPDALVGMGEPPEALVRIGSSSYFVGQLFRLLTTERNDSVGPADR